jgi:hypothetical protein
MLSHFQKIQKESAKVNRLVASMPTKREDRPGFFATISASDFYYLATENSPLGRMISPPIKSKRLFRGDFAMLLSGTKNLSLVEILTIRGKTVTKGGKQRVSIEQLFMTSCPFPKDVVILYRHFAKSDNPSSGVFFSCLDQLWEYKSPQTLAFIIPKDRVKAEWWNNERWKVDIGTYAAGKFIEGGRKRFRDYEEAPRI